MAYMLLKGKKKEKKRNPKKNSAHSTLVGVQGLSVCCSVQSPKSSKLMIQTYAETNQ